MVRKLLTWTAIAFAVYYFVAFPEQAALAVRSAGLGLKEVADQVVLFASSLFT